MKLNSTLQVILSVLFFSFCSETLMLIIYYPAPIAPFNIPKVLYTAAYYVSLLVFGIALAKTSRYGKSFAWIFGLFVLFNLMFAYIFSNISYLFMGNNLGAQLGEFKSLMPKILPLSIFINIPILIFGYSIAFITHSVYGKYSIDSSKKVGDRKVFIFSSIIILLTLLIFIPTICNINDIGSYWNRVDYNLQLRGNGNASRIVVSIKNDLYGPIEIINIYIPIYLSNGDSLSFGTNSLKGSRIVKTGQEKVFTIDISQPLSNIRIGKSYIKLLYKGKILRKDY